MTELISAPQQDTSTISPEALDFVRKAFKKVDNATIVGLLRSIGTKGYDSITARITIVELIWDKLDEARSLLKPHEDFLTWERLYPKSVFNKENDANVPWKIFNGMSAIWASPCVGAFDEMFIEHNTFDIWHDLARYKAVLDIYRPATVKDARKIITAVKNGNTDILIKFCIDDSPDVLEKVKEAAGDKYNSRSGMAKTGRKTVDPRAKAWEKFSEGAWECLVSKMEPKVLIDHIKSLTKTKEFVSQAQ